ncbi:MAG: hypothetical protein CXR30_10055 [Geobacter sp.]|nr:MAG: hypothetical protein CXR30_10055 [Geobacter sp.]
MDENLNLDIATYGPALRIIRKRRKVFFGTILSYIPALWITYKISPHDRSMGTVFVIWVIILTITTFWSAVATCPRCGKYFHVNGMTILYLRKCLHCQLHINADKEQ